MKMGATNVTATMHVMDYKDKEYYQRKEQMGNDLGSGMTRPKLLHEDG